MTPRRGVQDRLQDRLQDICSTAQDAADFAAGLDAAGFAELPDTDRRTYRALKNALAEIGEAVKLLPPDLLARHPGVDWRGWAGLRDVVPHQFSLELSRLRPTVSDDLPVLPAAIRMELGRPEAG